MKITDSRATYPKLIDGTPETLETLRQADAFMRLAQDMTLSEGQRQGYAQMATLRYNKVYVRVDEDGNVVS
jgi:sulfur transfer protein SufE